MAYPADTRRWTNAGPSRSWSGCEALVTTRPAASGPFARCPARKGQGDQELTCRFERREKFANLPRALSEEAPRKNRYEVGDIAYWSPDHQVAVNYRQDGEQIPAALEPPNREQNREQSQTGAEAALRRNQCNRLECRFLR